MLDAAGARRAGARGLSGIRILVVEDEFLLADLIGETLADAGAVVVGPAATLEDGLSLLETEALDVAVLDVNLRGKSVQPLAMALHVRGKPFVFLSGYRDIADLRRHFPDAPMLEKPADLGTLQRAVTALLGDHVSL